MTRDDLIAALRAIAERQEAATDRFGQDIEKDHMEADNLLLAFIADPAVSDAFRAVAKWYA